MDDTDIGDGKVLVYDSGAGKLIYDTVSGTSGSGDKIEEGDSSVEVVDTGTYSKIVFSVSGTETARVDTEGKWGIGETSPKCWLHIKSPDSTYAPIVADYSGGKYVSVQAGGSSVGCAFEDSASFSIWAQPVADKGTMANRSSKLKIDDESFYVGVHTSSPSNIFSVNKNSGDALADGWDVYSTAADKEEIRELDSSVVDTFKNLKVYQWKRRPYVSAVEIRDAVIAKFGQKRWDKLYKDEEDYRGGKLWNCPDIELKTFIDNFADTKRAERRLEPKWQKLHYGYVADEGTLEKYAPDLLSKNDKGEIQGVSLGNQAGLQAAVIKELINRIESLEAEVAKLKNE